MRRIVIQAGLLGLLWSVLPVLTMPKAQGFSDAMPMLVASVLAGMIGCGGFAMLTLPAAAIAYSTPMVVGALWALATSHDRTTAMPATVPNRISPTQPSCSSTSKNAFSDDV